MKLDISNIYPFVNRESVYGFESVTMKHQASLHEKTGAGNDFLGWLELPGAISEDLISDIETTAQAMRKDIDAVVVIGIGGSYLGAKAMIEALSHNFKAYLPERNGPDVFFAGQNIGEDYLAELLEVLNQKNFGIIVISKSGTTTEPAIAFRLFKELLIKQVGENEASRRIIAITDEKKGALRTLAQQSGYKSFIISDDIGGRYSVLTPVGLLPIAVAGYDIRQFINGAKAMQKQTEPGVPFEDNPAAVYAAARNSLYQSGKTTEILANFDPKLVYLSEWWKQLYGESEGKELKGIFPASVNFTADLHSMGQYIQEGERKLFETVISVEKPARSLNIPEDEENLDQLNYLAGKNIDAVNKMAELGTSLAHVDGGVPNMRIEIPSINEFYLGELVYFFEKACGISGYLLGVNPFDQPGVEAYKKNMFALLEKPGFEQESRSIRERLRK